MRTPRLILIWFLLLAPNSLMAAPAVQVDHALVTLQGAVQRAMNEANKGHAAKGVRPGDLAGKLFGSIRSIESAGRPTETFDSRYLIQSVLDADYRSTNAKKALAYSAVSSQIDLIREQIDDYVKGSDDNQIAGQVRAGVVADLSSSQYGYEPPPSADWGTKLAQKISQFLNKLFPRMAPVAPFSIPTGFFVGLVIVVKLIGAAIVIALICYIVVQIAQWQIRRGVRFPLDAGEEALLEARDTDSILNRANELAHSGDHRRAFRLVYLATLVALDTDGILIFDRSKTNWEYLRALRAAGRGDLYNLLTPFTRDFDHIWYGFGTADAGVFSAAVNRYQELKASSRQPVASAPQAGA